MRPSQDCHHLLSWLRLGIRMDYFPLLITAVNCEVAEAEEEHQLSRKTFAKLIQQID
jgi:hypothetical protein